MRMLIDIWRDGLDGKLIIIIASLCVLLLFVTLFAAHEQESEWQEFVEENNCRETGEKRLDYITQPTYMMVGNVMMPVGGSVHVYEHEYVCDDGKKYWH